MEVVFQFHLKFLSPTDHFLNNCTPPCATSKPIQDGIRYKFSNVLLLGKYKILFSFISYAEQTDTVGKGATELGLQSMAGKMFAFYRGPSFYC